MTVQSAKVPTGGAIGDGAKVRASARISSKSIKDEATEFDSSINEGVISPEDDSSSDDNEVIELKTTIKKLKIKKMRQHIAILQSECKDPSVKGESKTIPSRVQRTRSLSNRN